MSRDRRAASPAFLESMHLATTQELAQHSGACVTRVTIREALTELPGLITDRAPNVEILDLSGNSLTDLPARVA